MSNLFTDLIVEEIVKFDPVAFTTRRNLSADFLLNSDVRMWRDYQLDALVMELRTYIFAETVHSETATVSVQIPVTWWDHFKIEYFPSWLLAKFPARKTTVSSTHTFEIKALYPEWRRKMEDMGKPVFRSFIRRVNDRH